MCTTPCSFVYIHIDRGNPVPPEKGVFPFTLTEQVIIYVVRLIIGMLTIIEIHPKVDKASLINYKNQVYTEDTGFSG